MELEFTEEAGNDLQYIRDFLVEAGVLNCEQIVAEILSSADKLRSFPRLGIKVVRADARYLVRDYFCRGFLSPVPDNGTLHLCIAGVAPTGK